MSPPPAKMRNPDLFHGTALFSPSVPANAKHVWVMHGGTISRDRQKPSYIFCDGPEDPWSRRLLELAVPAFHFEWIVNSVSWNCLLPLRTYVLDDRYSGCSHSLATDDSQATLCTGDTSKSQADQELASSQTLIALPSPPSPVARRPGPRKWPIASEYVPSASDLPRHVARKARLDDDSGLVVSSTPVSRPQKHKLRLKSTPYLDLRPLDVPKAPSSSLNYEVIDPECERKAKVALKASTKLRQMLKSSDAVDGCPRISVSAVLSVLQDVVVDDIVRFEPGGLWKGQELRCERANPIHAKRTRK